MLFLASVCGNLELAYNLRYVPVSTVNKLVLHSVKIFFGDLSVRNYSKFLGYISEQNRYDVTFGGRIEWDKQ